ncbi:hypothetical protein CIW52_28275 [Mycolicibacterium sp. P9-64]|nr:hypothetical protein CIW52_28275 [Mycolicibacterium sp. P9-64]
MGKLDEAPLPARTCGFIRGAPRRAYEIAQSQSGRGSGHVVGRDRLRDDGRGAFHDAGAPVWC